MLWKYIFIIFLINKVYGHDLSTQIDQILKENLAKYGGQISRVKRDKTSTFYMEKNKVDLPICQNMKGILGNNFRIIIYCLYFTYLTFTYRTAKPNLHLFRE